MRKIKLDGADHYRASDIGDSIQVSRNILAKVLKDLPEVKKRTVGRAIFVPCGTEKMIRAACEKRREEFIKGCRERANALNEKVRKEREMAVTAEKSQKAEQAQEDLDLGLKIWAEIREMNLRISNIEAVLVRLSKAWE